MAALETCRLGWGSKFKNGPIKKTQDPAGSIHKKAREKTDPQKRVFDDGVGI